MENAIQLEVLNAIVDEIWLKGLIDDEESSTLKDKNEENFKNI